jgi:hypothetical protein
MPRQGSRTREGSAESTRSTKEGKTEHIHLRLWLAVFLRAPTESRLLSCREIDRVSINSNGTTRPQRQPGFVWRCSSHHPGPPVRPDDPEAMLVCAWYSSDTPTRNTDVGLPASASHPCEQCLWHPSYSQFVYCLATTYHLCFAMRHPLSKI